MFLLSNIIIVQSEISVTPFIGIVFLVMLSTISMFSNVKKKDFVVLDLLFNLFLHLISDVSQAWCYAP